MKDASSVLTAEEFECIQLHYNIYEQGEMHNDPEHNVLFVDKDPDVISSLLKKPQSDVENLILSTKEKMLEARRKRKTPFIDKTMYSGWNAMMISAYVEAYKAFGIDYLKDFALQSLDRILSENVIEKNFVTHRAAITGREGFLDDQVETVKALLDAYEVTSASKYLEAAISIINKTIDLFWDTNNGAFTDTPNDHKTIGALSIVNKPIQDSPTPGANAVAIGVLNRLSMLTEDTTYREYAEKTLQYFSGSVRNYGMFGASYFLALHEFLNPPPHVVVVGDERQGLTTELFNAALRTYRPGKVVTMLSLSNLSSLPKTVKAMVKNNKLPLAYVCTNFSCAPPAANADDLIETLTSFGRTEQVTS
ncbi:MAG: thioredoxin domain-containing protein [Ignavibacteriales bacterium]|nr:thioredoxin domain-containing protein [Ignavibacteriales bacterium]